MDACGPGRELAGVVLYLLTDDGQGRPVKSRRELEVELGALGRDIESLDLVLDILVASDLVVTDPKLADHFRLVHDYLAEFVRKTQGTALQIELGQERHKRQGLERSVGDLERRRRQIERRIKWLNVASVTGLLIFGGVFFWSTRALDQVRVATQLEKDSRLAQRDFEVHRELEALLASTHTGQKLNGVVGNDSLDTYPTVQPVYRLNEMLRQIRARNTLKGHSNWVNSANFSPDGSTIVSASDDQTVKLWDARTGEELRTLKGHSNWVLSASFSPDGSTVVSAADDQTVKLWKVETLEELLARSCEWLTPYLTSSPDVDDEDRALCGLPPREQE